ncbi:MAG TPA: response regulator [Polyangiaceae bacterium]|nr:response regulator [Polyangiaceae bacterium]
MHSLLVVEDNDDVREATQIAFEQVGHQVAAVGNGQEAIDWLAAHDAPCLILLDLMMPVMDGWQFLEAVQAHASWSTIPVVVVSSAQEDGIPGHARAILRKPASLESLLSAVEHCSCRRRHA